MKINLAADTIVASGLDGKKAARLLQKANKTKATKYLTFHITTGPKEQGWKLVARANVVTRAFIKNPEYFYIEDTE